MKNEENESANIKALHPLIPQQDNRAFESIPKRPAPWSKSEAGSPMNRERALSMFRTANQWLYDKLREGTSCECGNCYLCAYNFFASVPPSTSAAIRAAAEEIAESFSADGMLLLPTGETIAFWVPSIERILSRWFGKGETERPSVQPDWATALPFQQQSVIFLGARGSDGIEKVHRCKAVQRAYRGTVFKAARYGRLLEWGEKADSFMSLDRFADDTLWTEDVNEFFDGVDGLPHHGYQHLMLGVEILGYKHPDARFRDRWHRFYLRCVDNLHLNPETELQMDERLSDWRRKHWS